MKIKSKRAEDAITHTKLHLTISKGQMKTNLGPFDCAIAKEDVKTIVLWAEEDAEKRAKGAFIHACPLTPSKDNFCGVAVCGECDATKNFLKKLNETQP